MNDDSKISSLHHSMPPSLPAAVHADATEMPCF